jgi:hypothetical protein
MIERLRKTAIEPPLAQFPTAAFLRAGHVGKTTLAKIRAHEHFVE